MAPINSETRCVTKHKKAWRVSLPGQEEMLACCLRPNKCVGHVLRLAVDPPDDMGVGTGVGVGAVGALHQHAIAARANLGLDVSAPVGEVHLRSDSAREADAQSLLACQTAFRRSRS